MLHQVCPLNSESLEYFRPRVANDDLVAECRGKLNYLRPNM